MNIDILELKREFQTYKNKISDIKKTIKYDERLELIKSLEEKTTKEGFWNDKNYSQSIIKKLNENKDFVEEYKKLESL